tara:strand:+ start:7561 stop:8352 length:792 start_codon:yes stop_codon:yes gene_type:complete
MSLNDHFDEIYCINLAKDTQRLTRFYKMADGLDFSFKRIRAIDGSTDISVKMIYSLLPKNAHARFANCRGQIATGMSHVKAIKDAKARGYEKILILEDDVIPDASFSEIMKDFYFPDNWSFIYLGGNVHSRSHHLTKFDDFFNNTSDVAGVYACAIHSSSFDQCISMIESNRGEASDRCLSKIHKKNKNNTFILNKNAFWPNVWSSNLRKPSSIIDGFKYLRKISGGKLVALNSDYMPPDLVEKIKTTMTQEMQLQMLQKNNK